MTNVTIWYDGGCPQCRREIALMKRLDWRQRIKFVDAEGPRNDCPIDRADLLARLHAMENGEIVSGAAAFAAMWRVIPLLRPLGLIARHPRVLSVLEHAYRQFLKIRPRLQRLFR